MQKQGPPRVRPVPSPDTLANAALHYLARFAASEAGLRRVLQNRIRRAILQHPDFATDETRQAQLAEAIEAIIERHRATGALNDAAYAEMKVRGLRRKGRSRRMIAQKLGSQGIDRDLVGDALTTFDDGEEPEAAELTAARALAKRRRLGPYRTTPFSDEGARRKASQKDVATLARAGFSMRIIRQALDDAAIEDDTGEDWD